MRLCCALFFSMQALLHPYFFAPPLPAHHSELPIPARRSKSSHSDDFDPLAPIENFLVKPEAVASCAALLSFNN